MDERAEIKEVENIEVRGYDAAWFTSLCPIRKREVLKEAVQIYPYLADHMRISGIRGRDEAFISHYSFKLMLDILRKK